MVILRLTALLWLLFLAALRRDDPTDTNGKNLTRPVPKIGGSRAEMDTRLPWYTSGFV